MTLALVVVTAAVVAAATMRWVVPALPQPDEDVPVPRFAELGRPSAVTASALTAALAAATLLLAPHHAWPVLWPLAALGAPVAVVDQLTTYLPNRLVRACWLGAIAGTPLSLHLTPQARSAALHMVLAVIATAAFFWAVWRLTGSLGFGDVRLAPLLALGAATISLATWWAFLLCGTLLGAMAGLTTQAWRRRRPHPLGVVFAYGPSLWLGLWLAVLLTAR